MTVTWDGVVGGDGRGQGTRHTVADRARAYEWADLLALLAAHPDTINSTRPGGTSWYAPLHQAAHGGAPVEVAARLIALGAWRLLPTAGGELPRDIALRRGHAHLADVLTPRPRLDLPAVELAAIQRRFHDVIREVARGLVEEHDLRLPELAILTELDEPAMWFPVPGMYGGFSFRLLPGPVLSSASWCRVVGGSGRRYEITADGSELVEAGFV